MMTRSVPPAPPSQDTVLEEVDYVIPGVPSISSLPPPASISSLPRVGQISLTIRPANGEEAIRLESNGDIFIYGRKTTNDHEVVEGMRRFLDQPGDRLIVQLREILGARPDENILDAARRAMAK